MAVDEDGRFEYVLESGSPRRWLDPGNRPFGRGYQLGINSAGDFAYRHLDFPDAQHSPDTDLGDITVERIAGGPFHFLVQDAAGAPIEGAALETAGHHALTGTEGRGRIDFLATGPAELLVGAPGFRARAVHREGG